MGAFAPFENEQSWSIGAGEGLTVQNGCDELSIFGEAKFEPSEAGRSRASELLSVLEAASALLADGLAPKGMLWAKHRAGALIVGGDADFGKGAPGRASLAEATAALARFIAAPGAQPKGPAA